MSQLRYRRAISGAKASKSGRTAGSTPACPEKRVENARRLFAAAVEALEPRQLLSTYTVTDLSDSATDTGSLRYAINAANNGGATTITFDPRLANKTIILTSGQLEIGNGANVTITAAGVAGITLSGDNASRVFQIDSNATAEIDDLTLANGNSNGDGGAIDNSGTLTLNADTITNSSGFNAAFGTGAGGGILSTGTLNVTNSTIYNNTGGGYGGGGIAIYNGNATLTNDTITGNSDMGGGGAIGGGVGAFAGSVTFVNTIVAGNTAPSGGPDVSGSVTSLGHNLIGDTTRSSGWISTDLTGTAASPLNPLLAPQLGNYGGPTQTFPLLPGSPALGAGTPGVTTDQRGVTRSATAPSIGAFESMGFNLNYSSGDNQSPLPGASFAPLVVTVTPVEAGDPVGGGVVQFTVNPVAGAGATLANASATINANGTASTAVTTNAVGGSYTVTAASVGVTGIATFHLTNSGGNIVVNTTADSTTTAPGVLSLREAITYANAISTPSTITFAPGLAGQTITLTGGEIAINQNITIDASGVGGVTLNGNRSSGFFNVSSTLSLNDLTLTNGAGGYYGGAIQNYGNLSVTNCVFSDNGANYLGGAIYSYNPGILNINNCVFSNDSADDGGAIYTVAYHGLSMTVANCTFDNDSSTGTGRYDGGGAIYAGAGGQGVNMSLSLINSTFSGDTAATSGGAIYNVLYTDNNPFVSSTAQTTLTNCTITGCTAGFNGRAIDSPGGGEYLTLNDTTVSDDTAANDGGAIYTTGLDQAGGEQVTLNDSTLSDDMAGNDGGAIYNTAVTSTTDSWILNDSTLSGDTAGNDGGAIYSGTNQGRYHDGDSVSVTLNDTTLTGNTAVNGGGIFSRAAAKRFQYVYYNASVTATDCTLSGNSASSSGGDIYTAGSGNSTLTLTNSILANSPHGGDYYSAGGTISGSNNLVDDGSDGLPDTIKANPLLGTLGNYGGPTQTIPLLPGSPAISAGVAVSGITTDQRGVPLPTTPDIGAYQYNLVVNTNADNVNDDNVSGPTVTLREAINYLNAYGAPGEITFAPSLTGETITLDGSDLELKATANAVTIDASSIGGITISGNLASRIFQVDSGATVYLTDLTITNGSAGSGGGIYNSGTLTVTGSTLANDSANDSFNPFNAFGGGGIYNGHDLTITNSTFTNDSAQDDGGAICSVGTLTITNSTFSNNGSEAYLGSGIYNGGGLTITSSTFSNNSGADFGGGICNDGGLTITSSTFSNDSADSGGGIFNQGGLTITNSTFNDSSARVGGGIYDADGLTITNSTFSNDSGIGGGIFESGGQLTITSSTFYRNSGNDVYTINAPTPTAYNSIFTGSIYGGLFGSNNLLSTAAAQGLSASVGTVEPSLAAFGLGTLGNYGGPTQTIPLLPGSPAIGAGVAIAGVTTDQTGYTRSSTAPSIGAYENEGFTISTTGGTPQATLNGTAFGSPLAVKVSSNNAALTNLSGGVITFTAPSTGATATLSSATATITSSNTASVTATANATPGNYNVGAGGAGIATPAPFSLANDETPSLTVTTNQDVVNPTDGLTSLREAIAYADAQGGGTINFASNLAGQTITLNGSDLELAATANPVTIDASSIGGITISGNTASNLASRIFQVDSGATVYLTDLTITNGSASIGGGILTSGMLTVTDSTFTNDSSTQGFEGGGGGIYNYNGGEVTITNSTFSNDSDNTYYGGGGGGIYNGHYMTVTNCTFTNDSTSWEGGAICNVGDLTVTNSTFNNNQEATFGNGIYNSGGLTVTNSTFSNNSGAYQGGGIFNDGGATATINSSTLSNDSAKDGGGIFNDGGLTITNSTFSNDSASYGGGIFNGGGLTITSSTFYGNSGYGSDIYSYNGTPTAYNSIFTDSISGGLSGSNNLLSTAGLPASVGTVEPTLAAFGLGTLGNYGGPTQTIPLLPGSPAIGAGVPIAGVTTDQRGLLRTATPDIGAYAYDYGLVVNSTADNVNDDNVSGPTVTLREAVNFANAYGGAADITFAPALAGQTITLDGSSQLELTATANAVTIDASSIGGITISGNTASRIFQVDSGATVYLTDLTIANGSASIGGGIITSGMLTVTDSSFTNDSSTQDQYGGGAGIYNYNGGELTITNSTFSNDSDNTDFVGGGGGIYNGHDMTVTNCTFTNDSTQWDGGAICNVGDLTVTNSTFNNDLAFNGGGIYNSGGLTVTNSTFSNAPEAYQGGGIFNDVHATATINSSTFSNDSAEDGGGIYNFGGLTITNSTFSNDSADNAGGGILNDGGGTLMITNSTFTNDSSVGGGIFNFGSLTITSSTFYGNSGYGSDIYSSSGTPTAYNSIFTGTISGGLSGSNNLLSTAGLPASVGTVEPTLAAFGLGTLGNYGGPTQTIPLLPGSPAIGAGVPIAGVTTDQTGYTRSATAPSIGAYENEGFTLTPIAGDATQSVIAGGNFANPLGVTVVSNNPLFTNLSGGVISYTVGSSSGGATATLSSLTASIGASNIAGVSPAVTAAANTVPGSYTVTPAASGAVAAGSFNLTNINTTFVTSVNPSAAYYPATFTATVSSPNNVTATGTIQFQINGVNVGSPIPLVHGSASYTTGPLAVGQYNVVAIYSGGNLPGSTSATYVQTVAYNSAVLCPPGTFSDNGTDDATTQLTSPGSYAANYGQTSATPAQPGYYVSTTGATTETTAGFGTYVPTAGATAAIPAPSGYYVNTTGATQPTIDPAGTYSVLIPNAMQGPLSPVYAQAGFYVPLAGQSTETPAQPGYYVPNTGATAETPASPGYFVSSSASYAEEAAPLGSYAPGYASVAATQAQPGYYVSSTGRSSETAAKPGYYVSTSGALAETEATPGYYVSTTAATAETAAGLGYYVAGYGATTETAATPGYYVPTSAATSATASPAGYYVPGSAASAPIADPAQTYSGVAATQAIPIFSVNPINITYGTILTNSELTGSTPPAVPGTLSFSTTAAGALLNAGSDQPELVTFTPNDKVDFATVSENAIVNVSQYTPAITVNDAGGVYMGSAYSATSTVTGVNNTNLTTPAVAFSYFYASDTSFQHQLASAPTNAGSYVVIAVYPGSANYAAVGVAAYFNITPAKPLVTITANGGVYSGSAIGATATVTGLNNIAASSLESVAPTLLYYTGSTASGTGSSTAPINAGTYTVVATFAGSADYSTASASKTFSITQAASSVSVTGKSGTYNGSPYGAIGSVSGVALSTTPTFTYTGINGTSYSSTTAPTNAGSYSVTATYLGDTNHTANSATATFTIGQATPSISVTDTGGVYNTLPYAATGTTTGVNGTSLGSPTYRYYLSSDTSFSNPTTTAPTNVGSYVLIALSPVNSNYMQVGVAVYFSITQASSVLTPVATTVAYGGSTTLSTTLKTTGGALLAGRTVTFSVNGKVIGTAVTNSSGVASLGDSVAGITPGVYASGIAVSFAGDANSTATSATASLTVLDAPIVSSVSVSNLLNIASVSGSFTQARTGAAASDFVATVNWGDGNTQTLLVVADLLHPGQFDLICLSHLYLQLNQKFTVTVTISTVGKFGAVAGTTTTITSTVVA